MTPIDCNARSAIPSAGVKDKKILSCYLKPQAIVKSSHSKVEKKQLPIFQEDNNDSEVVSTNSKDEEFWALQNRKEEVQCLEQNQAICLHKLV